VVVDVRAGEGAGSSAAFLHRSPEVVFPLWFLQFFSVYGVLVEE
jgi:hypothetical protein